MNAQQKRTMYEDAQKKLKLASGYADAMAAAPVSVEATSTLLSLTQSANASVMALRSAVVTNENPKVGG